MPRKIRDLVAELKGGGFSKREGRRSGKGSHRNFIDGKGNRVTISGHDGDDAHPYQEREVRKAIEKSQTNEHGQKQGEKS